MGYLTQIHEMVFHGFKQNKKDKRYYWWVILQQVSLHKEAKRSIHIKDEDVNYKVNEIYRDYNEKNSTYCVHQIK